MPDAGTPPDLVVIGRVAGAHGVAGALRVTSFTDPGDNLTHYRPWLMGDGMRYREVNVESVQAQGRGFVARITGVGDRDDAQALAGQLIAVPRVALPEPDDEDEYYWRDLIGLVVTDEAGRELGRVENLMATGAHDVLVVSDGERQTLIPFQAQFVRSVDLGRGRLTVDWQGPEG